MSDKSDFSLFFYHKESHFDRITSFCEKNIGCETKRYDSFSRNTAGGSLNPYEKTDQHTAPSYGKSLKEQNSHVENVKELLLHSEGLAGIFL